MRRATGGLLVLAVRVLPLRAHPHHDRLHGPGHDLTLVKFGAALGPYDPSATGGQP